MLERDRKIISEPYSVQRFVPDGRPERLYLQWL
jgi:hypothetical protein